MTSWWSDSDVDKLKALRAEGLSHAQVAQRTGRTRNAVASAVRRYVHGIPDLRKGRVKKRPNTGSGKASCWDESMLTEPYAMRKARRMK